MSKNAIYDVIEDEVCRIMEEDGSAVTWLPERFRVNLEPDQLKAFLDAGLYRGGEKIDSKTSLVQCDVLDYAIEFGTEPPEKPETLH